MVEGIRVPRGTVVQEGIIIQDAKFGDEYHVSKLGLMTSEAFKILKEGHNLAIVLNSNYCLPMYFDLDYLSADGVPTEEEYEYARDVCNRVFGGYLTNEMRRSRHILYQIREGEGGGMHVYSNILLGQVAYTAIMKELSEELKCTSFRLDNTPVMTLPYGFKQGRGYTGGKGQQYQDFGGNGYEKMAFYKPGIWLDCSQVGILSRVEDFNRLVGKFARKTMNMLPFCETACSLGYLVVLSTNLKKYKSIHSSVFSLKGQYSELMVDDQSNDTSKSFALWFNNSKDSMDIIELDRVEGPLSPLEREVLDYLESLDDKVREMLYVGKTFSSVGLQALVTFMRGPSELLGGNTQHVIYETIAILHKRKLGSYSELIDVLYFVCLKEGLYPYCRDAVDSLLKLKANQNVVQNLLEPYVGGTVVSYTLIYTKIDTVIREKNVVATDMNAFILFVESLIGVPHILVLSTNSMTELMQSFFPPLKVGSNYYYYSFTAQKYVVDEGPTSLETLIRMMVGRICRLFPKKVRAVFEDNTMMSYHNYRNKRLSMSPEKMDEYYFYVNTKIGVYNIVSKQYATPVPTLYFNTSFSMSPGVGIGTTSHKNINQSLPAEMKNIANKVDLGLKCFFDYYLLYMVYPSIMEEHLREEFDEPSVLNDAIIELISKFKDSYVRPETRECLYHLYHVHEKYQLDLDKVFIFGAKLIQFSFNEDAFEENLDVNFIAALGPYVPEKIKPLKVIEGEDDDSGHVIPEDDEMLVQALNNPNVKLWVKHVEEILGDPERIKHFKYRTETSPDDCQVFLDLCAKYDFTYDSKYFAAAYVLMVLLGYPPEATMNIMPYVEFVPVNAALKDNEFSPLLMNSRYSENVISYLIPEHGDQLNTLFYLAVTQSFDPYQVKDFLSNLALAYQRIRQIRVVILLCGLPSSGKTYLVKCLTQIFESSVFSTSKAIKDVTDKVEIKLLASSYLFVCNETKSMSAHVINFISGGDTTSTRPLYSNDISSDSCKALVMAVCNEPPTIHDMNSATMNRIGFTSTEVTFFANNEVINPLKEYSIKSSLGGNAVRRSYLIDLGENKFANELKDYLFAMFELGTSEEYVFSSHSPNAASRKRKQQLFVQNNILAEFKARANLTAAKGLTLQDSDFISICNQLNMRRNTKQFAALVDALKVFKKVNEEFIGIGKIENLYPNMRDPGKTILDVIEPSNTAYIQWDSFKDIVNYHFNGTYNLQRYLVTHGEYKTNKNGILGCRYVGLPDSNMYRNCYNPDNCNKSLVLPLSYTKSLEKPSRGIVPTNSTPQVRLPKASTMIPPETLIDEELEKLFLQELAKIRESGDNGKRKNTELPPAKRSRYSKFNPNYSPSPSIEEKVVEKTGY